MEYAPNSPAPLQAALAFGLAGYPCVATDMAEKGKLSNKTLGQLLYHCDSEIIFKVRPAGKKRGRKPMQGGPAGADSKKLGPKARLES